MAIEVRGVSFLLLKAERSPEEEFLRIDEKGSRAAAEKIQSALDLDAGNRSGSPRREMSPRIQL